LRADKERDARKGEKGDSRWPDRGGLQKQRGGTRVSKRKRDHEEKTKQVASASWGGGIGKKRMWVGGSPLGKDFGS